MTLNGREQHEGERRAVIRLLERKFLPDAGSCWRFWRHSCSFALPPLFRLGLRTIGFSYYGLPVPPVSPYVYQTQLRVGSMEVVPLVKGVENDSVLPHKPVDPCGFTLEPIVASIQLVGGKPAPLLRVIV